MNEKESLKKGGKKSEPTSEELEFIYERLSQLSDRELREEMEDSTLFPHRSLGFIKRRRVEFSVAQRVIARRVEGAFDVDPIERRKKHWNRLSERAEEFASVLRSIRQSTLNTGKTIFEAGIDDDNKEILKSLDDFRTKCLLSHLQVEMPQLQILTNWDDLRVKDITEQLLVTLSLKAEQAMFRGTCEVCRDWE